MKCAPACASIQGGVGRRSACVRICAPGARPSPTAMRWLRSREMTGSAKLPPGSSSRARSGAARWRWRLHARRFGSRVRPTCPGTSARWARLRDGLATLANQHGIAIRQSGPPQMPLVLFDADSEFRKGRAFCSAALRQGAFFHPQHNMFLSAAHHAADIDAALEAASHGFRAVLELDARINAWRGRNRKRHDAHASCGGFVLDLQIVQSA